MEQYEDQYTPPPFDPATVMERMKDGVAVLDHDWRFAYLNETGARIVGQPKAALLGKVIWEVYPEDVGSVFAENYRAARDTQRPITFEEYHPPFKVWFAITVYPTDGGVTIYYEDITKRKEAEAAVAASERRFRALIERSADACVLLNAAGVVQYVSPSITRLLGYAPDALIGTSTFDLIHPDDVALMQQVFGRIVATPGATETAEYRLRGKDGLWRWFEGTGTNLLDEPSVQAIVGNFHDITDRHESKEAMQEFVAMMAHELRNPLTSIAGYAQLMQKRERYDKKAMATILTQITRLDRLTQDLHDSVRLMGKAPELEIALVDVAALVTTTVEQAQMATETHTLRVEMSAHLPTAYWDADRVVQALRNLLSNAIKYTPAGGVIVVQVQGMGDAVQIAVTDQGIGIPPEAMRRLFMPFYRAENAQMEARGMGLGLTVSKGFVEAHGGHIGVASVEGEGSTFTIILPYREG